MSDETSLFSGLASKVRWRLVSVAGIAGLAVLLLALRTGIALRPGIAPQPELAPQKAPRPVHASASASASLGSKYATIRGLSMDATVRPTPSHCEALAYRVIEVGLAAGGSCTIAGSATCGDFDEITAPHGYFSPSPEFPGLCEFIAAEGGSPRSL